MDQIGDRSSFLRPFGLPGRIGRFRDRRQEQAQGLLDLAEYLSAILTPVEPRPGYRLRLHEELVRNARSRSGQVAGPVPQGGTGRQPRKGLLIGVAALGSLASVAGVVIAVLLRHRHSRTSHAATG